MVTVAPGSTAPCSSLTTPSIAAPVCAAVARGAERNREMIRAATTGTAALIAPPRDRIFNGWRNRSSRWPKQSTAVGKRGRRRGYGRDEGGGGGGAAPRET